MKTKTLLKLWICIALIVLGSCGKENDLDETDPEETDPVVRQEPPVTVPDMLACHRTATWDSAAIHDKLLGKWEWEYIRCFWSQEKGNYDDFEGLVIEFKEDSTLEVEENGQITQTSTWKVEKLYDGNHRIATDPIMLLLPGQILFCEDRVLFNDSYVDGCDNYYQRI